MRRDLINNTVFLYPAPKRHHCCQPPMPLFSKSKCRPEETTNLEILKVCCPLISGKRDAIPLFINCTVLGPLRLLQQGRDPGPHVSACHQRSKGDSCYCITLPEGQIKDFQEKANKCNIELVITQATTRGLIYNTVFLDLEPERINACCQLFQFFSK